MKILLTGASSFTGYWFARELKSAGHDVCIVLRRHFDEYQDDVRRKRVSALKNEFRTAVGVSFGDDRFLGMIEEGWDLLCHHAAEVTNYRSPDFNVAAAVESNTHRLSLVLDRLKASGCERVVLTGSFFENDEGAGSGEREAFSPYGISKGLTWQVFRYHAKVRDIRLGKFVIPNPFGPYEEPRFTPSSSDTGWPVARLPSMCRTMFATTFMFPCWPRPIFTSRNHRSAGISRTNPSGYVEFQGAFTQRFAREMGKGSI